MSPQAEKVAAWVCEGPEAEETCVRILGAGMEAGLATRALLMGIPRGHKAQVHRLGLGAHRSLQTCLRSSPWPVAWLLGSAFQLPHLFLGLLAIGVSSLEKCLFKPFADV